MKKLKYNIHFKNWHRNSDFGIPIVTFFETPYRHGVMRYLFLGNHFGKKPNA